MTAERYTIHAFSELVFVQLCWRWC